ncbi:MAG: hypothetical protein AB1Z98_31355 [Nannocystaceae bacterium]
MPTILELERFYMNKLAVRYGGGLGLTALLVDHVFRGTATDDERATYEVNAETVVLEFKAYLRATAYEAYTDEDLDIIVAMIEAGYRRLGEGGGAVVKVVSEGTAASWLTYDGTGPAPAIAGFVMSGGRSEGLSAGEMSSEFGVDVAGVSGGVPDGDDDDDDGGAVVGAMFVLEQPTSVELVSATRMAMDPALLARVEALASRESDHGRPGRVATYLSTYRDKIVVLVLRSDDVAAIKTRFPGYTVQEGLTPSYRVASGPGLGTAQASNRALAAAMLEHYLASPQPVSNGAVLKMKLPKGSADPASGDRPKFSPIEVAHRRGNDWEFSARPSALENALNRATRGRSPAVMASLRRELHKVTSSIPLRIRRELETSIERSWGRVTRKLVAVGEMSQFPLPPGLGDGGAEAARRRRRRRLQELRRKRTTTTTTGRKRRGTTRA